MIEQRLKRRKTVYMFPPKTYFVLYFTRKGHCILHWYLLHIVDNKRITAFCQAALLFQDINLAHCTVKTIHFFKFF